MLNMEGDHYFAATHMYQSFTSRFSVAMVYFTLNIYYTVF